MEYSDLDVPSTWSRGGKALVVVASIIGLGGVALYQLNTTSAEASTDLLGMSMKVASPPTLASLPGPKKWKELALAAIEVNNRCEVGGPRPTPRFTAAMANMGMKDITLPATRAKATMTPPRFTAAMAKKQQAATDGKAYQEDDRVGAFLPLGYWDPAGFATDVTEGQLGYIREAELKHGRICMLASLGIFVAEKWHPLFGGAVDVPAIDVFGAVELGYFWPAVLIAASGIEILGNAGRTDPAIRDESRGDAARNTPELKPGIIPGDVGFDPFGFKTRSSPEEFYKLQEREIAHARLAMIATLGMLSQELAFPGTFIGYASPF